MPATPGQRHPVSVGDVRAEISTSIAPVAVAGAWSNGQMDARHFLRCGVRGSLHDRLRLKVQGRRMSPARGKLGENLASRGEPGLLQAAWFNGAQTGARATDGKA